MDALNADDVHETDSEDLDKDFVTALPIMPKRDTFPKIPVRTSRKCGTNV